MSDKYDDILGYISRAITAVIVGLLTLLCIELLCSCTRTVYVPQTTVKTDSVYITNYQKDSVYLRDSVFIHSKADTLLIEKWHTKYVERLSTDTLYIYRADTIREEYPVERQMTRSERMFQSLGKMSLGMVLTLAGLCIYLYRKRYT